MVTFTINIPPMLPYIPYMDPMGMTPCISLIFREKYHGTGSTLPWSIACIADRQLLGSSRPRMIPTSQELGAKRCVKTAWFLRFHSLVSTDPSKTTTTTRTAPVMRDWRCRSSEDSDLVRLLTSIHRHYNNSFTDREKQAEADRQLIQADPSSKQLVDTGRRF